MHRSVIDYAMDDNGTEFRKALYASIHDKVSAHIESKKQEIAQGLLGVQQEEEQEEEYYDDEQETDQETEE